MAPPAVAELRKLIGDADALLLSTPEYAHGLPGSFKNTLDWLVSSVEFPGIPVAVINPSLESFHANESLIEILRTMSAQLPEGGSVRIPIVDRTMDAARIANDSQLSAKLLEVIGSLTTAPPRERLYQ